MSESISAPASLIERKRVAVHRRIVTAADELFAAEGFDNVSVTDIAERADVGRTTFFRYFGDKAEVVFAHEQEMVDTITDLAEHDSSDAARTLAQALEQLRPIVIDLCDKAGANADGYALHQQLIQKHIELTARDALKTQRIADKLTDLLISRGTDDSIALLAAQVALACYLTARRRATNARSLSDQAEVAFAQVAALDH